MRECNDIENKISEEKTIEYDESVSNEEIEDIMNNISKDNLTANEVIFLKFINNKEVNITFSSRWEHMYELKPTIEIEKLIKLEYLTYSSWDENVKNATTKELKEILKTEDLKISGSKQELVERVLGNVDTDLLEKKFNKRKYTLTDKGKEIIEKNKSLFMSERET